MVDLRRSAVRAAACPESLAADVAAKTFESGGGAFDGAISGAFAQAVTNPLGTGIAGMAHIMVIRPGDDEPAYLNASVETGSLATPDIFSRDFIGRSERVGRYLVREDRNQYGYPSIMTPGFVRGMAKLHEYGPASWPWRRLVGPSAKLATDGFEVYPYLAEYFTFEGPSRPGYPDIFKKLGPDNPARDLILPGGRPIPAGQLLRQSDYGATLERIAEAGADDFYSGSLGAKIAADLSAHGALVTTADMAGYTVRVERPSSVEFGDGLVIFSAPPPSQGVVLLTMLKLVEGMPLKSLDRTGPDYAELMAWVTRTAFAECLPFLADPRFVDVPTDWMLSASHLDQARAESRDVLAPSAMSDHTTHISACDSDGSFVSITHSIGSVTGAGVMTPGLGFFYNNFLGHFNVLAGYHDSIAPGKRMGGGCPSIVYRKGKPWMAIGSSGGPRLVSAVFQTLLDVTIRGMSLQEAVSSPRLHCEQAKKLYIEPGFPPATRRALEERGYELTVTSYMGCNQAVAIDGGEIQTGSDPRGGVGVATWSG